MLSNPKRWIILAAMTSLEPITQAQTATRTMRSTAGHDARRGTSGDSYTASHEVHAAMALQMKAVDATRDGAVYLEVSAKTRGARPTEILLRVPLASTSDAYGETHQCLVNPEGKRTLIFNAGLDEVNSIPFKPAAKPKEIDLLLNKYLCLAMAAPFDCAGEKVTLPERWDSWQLAGTAQLRITSAAPATLETSPVVIAETATPFSKAQCASFAPGAHQLH